MQKPSCNLVSAEAFQYSVYCLCWMVQVVPKKTSAVTKLKVTFLHSEMISNKLLECKNRMDKVSILKKINFA